MKRLKSKLSAIAMILVLAVCACGMSLFAFAEDSTTNEVDSNGWNTQINRGGVLANGGHTLSDENFTTYTNLQDGDVITYGDKIHSPIVEGVVRTMPWQMSFNAVGETGASITYEIYTTSGDVYYKATMEIGGSSFKDNSGFGAVSKDRTFESGVTSTLCFEGHHEYGGNVYWVDPKAAFNAGYETCASMNTTWATGDKPTEFNLKVTVNGNIDKLSVKVGDGLLFQQCSYLTWQWGGYNDGYAAQNDCGAQYGIKAPQNNDSNYADYFVFKNYEFKFFFSASSQNDENMPVVTVAGERVDSDNELDASGMFRGYYVHTVPYSAQIKYDHTPEFEVHQGDTKIFYKNGDSTLLTAYVHSGDKAINHSELNIPGKFILGWTTDVAGQNDYDFTTPVTGDLTLYAKLGNAVLVNFKDGNNNLAQINYRTGDTITKIANPEKSGYIFAGWYTDNTYSTEFDFTAPIAAGVEEINICAKWNINVSYQIIGYNGKTTGDYPVYQTKVIAYEEGAQLTASDFPTFAQITTFPEFSNIELKWFTDVKAKNPVDFNALGTVTSATTYYALALDKSDSANDTYVQYDLANGFDRNASAVARDEAGNALTNNTTINNAIGNVNGVGYGMNPGSYRALDNGYAQFTMPYVGYEVNARKLDVNKPIYIDYTISSNAEDMGDGQGNTYDGNKYFSVGFYNSLTSALISQGQNHEPEFGRLFGWLQWVKTDVQANQKLSMHSASNSGFYGSELPLTGYQEGLKVSVKIEIDADGVTVTFLSVGDTTLTKDNVSRVLDINKSMFPNGVYVSFACARPTDVVIRVTQDGSTATVADGATGINITTAEASEGMFAGEKVEFTVEPPAGHFFTTEGVFANGKRLNILGNADDGYYFNMPLGTNEITVKWGINITFTDGAQWTQAIAAVEGEAFSEVNTPTAPAKTGYKTNVVWCTDADLQTPYDFANPITAAITLYAKYVPEQYSLIIVDSTDSSQIGETIKADFGSTFAKPAADPVKDGYVFKGYYTDEDCTEEYSWDTVVTAGNHFVYAKFEAASNNTPAENNKKKCGGNAVASSAVGASIALMLAAGAIFVGKRKATDK